MFRKIGDLLSIATGIVLAIPLLLISGIFILLLSPFMIVNNARRQAAYRAWLLTIEGQAFICYTNNRKTHGIMAEEVLPRLAPRIQPILLEGRNPRTEPPLPFASQMLYDIEAKGGQPWLIKVERGRVRSRSVNNEVYNTIAGRSDMQKLLTTVWAWMDGK